jgi:hypothetical protein
MFQGERFQGDPSQKAVSVQVWGLQIKSFRQLHSHTSYVVYKTQLDLPPPPTISFLRGTESIQLPNMVWKINFINSSDVDKMKQIITRTSTKHFFSAWLI